MDQKPIPEGSSGEPRNAGDAGTAPQPEAYGVLELTRLHKEDGRALLLFRRAGDR